VQKVEHVVAANLVEINLLTACDEQIDGNAITQVGPARFLLATLNVLSRGFGDPSARREAGINIDYGYCGVDPSTNATMLLLGVADAGKAVKVLEQAAAASATS
jgi:hypothetical protein